MKDNIKIKVFSYKEFENKREELVNFLFHISASYHETQNYTANIAEEVTRKKYNILKDLSMNIEKNSNSFVSILLLDNKPTAYAICYQESQEEWEIGRIVTAKEFQNKGYAYITERFCLNQIALLQGKYVKAFVDEKNIISNNLQISVGFKEVGSVNSLKIYELNLEKNNNN